ncbi:MAG: GNAT family N-acetyltransferase [Chitinophagaceae bacterium]|nr:GNAT family N-acetyltransferase [Chitinophagaceae bacterium]MBK8607323.1 GNAT family N-acetyltransferase [Chitinophagaceae bacterium]MBP6477822.1 GNAT family N-acetyltransferase [Chitinophagaceae bacterium]MBP7109277.1 GNAT family N-acetyltransferase [Chitinophagaceae bacterium]MBP7314195.1 GNAT family N-acetyltransferase [Chitinophagaceae bacterium]
MLNEITIRNATINDIELIRELTFKVWPQTYSSIISKEQIDYMLEMMYSNKSLALQMAEGSQFIIVQDTKKPVGFASYKPVAINIYKLDKIYILQTQQGKGIGKFVIDYILQQIKDRGAESLQLQVNRNNINAKSFYEKIGFRIIQEADFEIGNGYFMNDFIMEKKI